MSYPWAGPGGSRLNNSTRRAAGAPGLQWLAAALLLCVHAGLALWSARANSATFDEPVLIGTGCSYWKTGDFRLQRDLDHAALGPLWLSFPLNFQKIALPLETKAWRESYAWAFSELLLFWNGNDADAMILSARLMNVGLSLVLGVWIWLAARREWGAFAGIMSLLFYCLSPSVLAHASLATTDFPATFFICASILLTCELARRPTPARAAAVPVAAVLGFFTKYSALLVWPVGAASLALESSLRPRSGPRALRAWLLFALLPGIAATALGFLFFPGAIRSLSSIFLRVAREGHPVFCLGRISDRGFPWLYLVALLTKSTLAELAVLLLVAVLAARRRIPASIAVAAPLLTIGAYLAAASLSHKQAGLRYVLAVYPMLALLAAPLARFLRDRPKGSAAMLCLGLWQAASAAGAAPQFLPYFNEAVGGAANGDRILLDSNLDWGQDLKRLAAYHREHGSPELILAYFGTASPEYYGLKAQQLGSANAVQRRVIDSDRPRAQWLVVSATYLRGVSFRAPATLTWLRGVEPTARVGAGLFVYDVTRRPDIHRALARTYADLGDPILSERELRRAAALESERPLPAGAAR